MAKTVVALYEDLDTAQNVVSELVDAGFARDTISIVASDASGEYTNRYGDGMTAGEYDDEDVKAGEGAGFGAVVGALVGLGVALIPGIGPVLAAGPLAAALMAGIGAAAGAVTGGVVASLVDFGIPEEEAHVYAESLRRGATLVSVTTDDAASARAEDILNRYHPLDVEQRSDYYRNAGWDEFDQEGEPYKTSDVDLDRQTYRDFSGSATGDAMARTGASTRSTSVSDYEPDTAMRQSMDRSASRTPTSTPSANATSGSDHTGTGGSEYGTNNSEVGDSVHSGAAADPSMTGAGTGAGDLVSNTSSGKAPGWSDSDDDTWDGSESTRLRQGGARSYSSKP